MQRSDLINLVLSRLGNRSGNTFLQAQAVLELQHIQRVAERGAILPWFLLTQTEQEITLTAATRLVALPSDFLREWDEWPLQLYDSTNTSNPYSELVKDDFDLLLSQYGGAASSTPEKYALVGNSVAPFPLASVDKKARFVYFQQQATLTQDSSTNAWTTYAEDFMLAKLGITMARYLRSDLLSTFQQDLAEALQRMNVEDVARKNAARDAFRGD